MTSGLRARLAALRETFLGDDALARSRRMSVLNRVSRTPLTGDGPEVSLTTHGDRVGRVHVTIETIARGTVRPSSITLWLDDPAVVARPPRALRRLERRGLRIRSSRNYGPHTKYYPQVLARTSFDAPLVTADDDMLYPITWLADLGEAHRRHPHDVLCHRARRVQVVNGVIGPYLTWPLVGSIDASPLNFATGVSGVLYPPGLLLRLKESGDGFLQACPRADDVWLHAAAVDAGYSIRQVGVEPMNYPTVTRTQGSALQDDNVVGGGNDAQVAATYSPSAVARLARAAGSALDAAQR